MENNDSKPRRRVRYKGTHPKAFHEKYKELQPGRYADDIQKIIQKGNTPAGMHRSICVNEILEILKLHPGNVGLDATLGYGGHSAEILKRLSPNGKLYAIDADPIELPRTTERLRALGYDQNIFDMRHLNFADIDEIIAETGPLDFILADLGLSSMQIDNPERGFSLKADGPLDLRLNPHWGKPASQLIKNISHDDLETLFIENADEPYAGIIAEAIVSAIRQGRKIDTTFHLKEIIKDTLDFLPQTEKIETVRKSCQRCFQAIRIEVNKEFEVLDRFLSKLPESLKEGGRIAILTFHSGEDRRVKKAFQLFFREGIFIEIAKEPMRPSLQEVGSNPRARSAKLRWAIKA